MFPPSRQDLRKISFASQAAPAAHRKRGHEAAQNCSPRAELLPSFHCEDGTQANPRWSIIGIQFRGTPKFCFGGFQISGTSELQPLVRVFLSFAGLPYGAFGMRMAKWHREEAPKMRTKELPVRFNIIAGDRRSPCEGGIW